MDLNDIHIKIKNEFSNGTMLNLIKTLDDTFYNLDEEDTAILFKWLEFEFLYEHISIYDTMQISWSSMKEQLSSDAYLQLETISKTKKRNIEYLERWIINNKPNNLKVELPEIDLSGSSATEKIIYLHKLGVIDYLKSKQPFLSSTNSLATILSAIIDEKPGTIQSMINPILSKKVDEKNNPLNSPKPVAKVIKQLNDIGFNLNKTI